MDINTRVNPNLHPSKVQGDSPGAKSARLALGGLYQTEGKIHDLHAVVKNKALLRQRQVMATMPTPAKGGPKVAPALVYDQGAADHIISVGQPLVLKALKAADAAITVLSETAGRLDAAISQKVMAAKSSRGTELRAWAASQKQPFQTLGVLMQNAHENAALVTAVLEAEPFLSKLSAENHAHLHTVAASVLAPDEVRDRKETGAALEHLTSAAKAFTATTGDIFNGLQSPTASAIDQIVSKGDDK